MPKKFICTFTKEELERMYHGEGRTITELCDIVGVKSPITMAKILKSNGISTDSNGRMKQATMKGMSDIEFKAFLTDEYNSGKSMETIGESLGVTPSCIRKYFVKYGIPRRKNTDFFAISPEHHPSWRGGRYTKSNGYVVIHMPSHPRCHKDGTIYEHQLVMEKHIGRYLKDGEVVHHIDGNKQNNKIGNLMLLTNSDHAKLHAIIKRSKKMMERG